MAQETLVITDIHGSYDELKKMLELVKYKPDKYKLIFLGDYVDRGLFTKDVIELLIQIKKENKETVFLIGNHDDWFISFLNNDLEDDVLDLWLRQGGFETLKSYFENYATENKSLRDLRNHINENFSHHVEFLNELELYHEDDNFYYAHGGCKLFESDISKNDKNDFIWPNRKMFYSTSTELDKPIIVGHTILKYVHNKNEPYISKDKICIDGGIVFGYVFVGMIIDNKSGKYKFEILSS